LQDWGAEARPSRQTTNSFLKTGPIACSARNERKHNTKIKDYTLLCRKGRKERE
jgi:hypothetical protein